MALNRYLRMQYIIPEMKKIKDSKVLDIGCLDGHFTQYFVGRGNEVYATDLQDSGITQALPEVSFSIARGQSLPFEDNFFDFIFCSDVFEHVEDFEDIVPEIYRVLKPEKTSLISTVEGYWHSPIKLRSFFLKYLPTSCKNSLMGRFAVSDEEVHRGFCGHVRYDITLEKLKNIFIGRGLIPIKEKNYCYGVGSLLMEIFYSFNEKIRYFTFPFLKLLIPLDRITFGQPWQYYVVFKKA